MIVSVFAVADTTVVSTAGALVGVIVGGLLNWAVQRRTEDRREARLAQAGARLVTRELSGADAALEATRQDSWIWRRARRLETASWDAYREPLAVRLSSEQWDAAADAVEKVRALDVRLEALLGNRSTTDRLSPEMQESVANVRNSLALALGQLDPDAAQASGRRRPMTTR